MAIKKKASMIRYYFFPLLDKVTFDQHMLFFKHFVDGFSYSASAWYATLNKTARLWSILHMSNIFFYKGHIIIRVPISLQLL